MFAFPVAWRYLFSRKSHNAVNVISIVSMLGVAVATIAIVCVLSVFNGFSDLAKGRMSKTDPQLKIMPLRGKVIASADSLAYRLERLDEVAAALPVVEEHALAMFGGVQMAVNINGVPSGYGQVTDMQSMVIDGGYFTSETDVPVATLSVGTAVRLKSYPGTESLISIYVPKRRGRINTANPMASFRADSLFIGGVYRTEDSDRDAQSVIIPIEMARRLLDYDSGEATAIAVAGAEGVGDDELAAAVREYAGEGLIIKNRLEQEAESFKMIAVEKWITFVMLAFIFIIASFNVVSTLSMLIIEKRSNMATMRAMGASRETIRNIFMWEGWLISTVGGVAGIIIGVALCLAQQIGGFIKLSGDPSQLAIESYPVRVAPGDLLIVMGLVVVVGFVVGWLTSRFAARS